jgi:hypothetical protein
MRQRGNAGLEKTDISLRVPSALADTYLTISYGILFRAVVFIIYRNIIEIVKMLFRENYNFYFESIILELEYSGSSGTDLRWII